MHDQARLDRPGRRVLVAAVACVVVLAVAAGAWKAAAEPVKLLKPDQYGSRIVAPRKGRVLLVNFWATWCEPCREEMPELAQAAKGFPSKDLAVVLVSLDSQKTGPKSVPKFLGEKKIPFVCWLLKARDPEDFINAVDSTWDGSLPYTLLYDRSGKIAVKLSGRQTKTSFEAAIRKALASAP